MSYTFTYKDDMSLLELRVLYDLLKADDKLWKILWYDSPPPDCESWLYRLQSWWFVRVNGAVDAPVGVFWLNGYQGRTAQIHFAVFKGVRHEAVQIGKATLQWLWALGCLGLTAINVLAIVYWALPMHRRYLRRS